MQRSPVNVLPDGGKLFQVNRDPNEDTSGSSGRDSPDPDLKIDDGSLTLAQFIAEIEARSGRVVQRMAARHRRRRYLMPVAVPQPNVDRFAGQGNQLVENVVYNLANQQRLSIHGIIEFFVQYVDEMASQDVYYHF